MRRFVGLTGGIAAGKSAVVAILRKHDVPVIDCDQLARDAVAPGAACLEKVIERFGQSAVTATGGLNRQFIAEQVFSDETKRIELEQIIHPYVEARMLAESRNMFSGGERLVVADVPLLFEVGWQKYFDEIWLVVCADDSRIKRLIARDKLNIETATARMAAQLSQTEKVKLADVILNNDKTFVELERQVVELVNKIKCRFVDEK